MKQGAKQVQVLALGHDSKALKLAYRELFDQIIVHKADEKTGRRKIKFVLKDGQLDIPSMAPYSTPAILNPEYDSGDEVELAGPESLCRASRKFSLLLNL